MEKKTKGLLLAFEGIDGSGKSTQARQLESWFNARGIPCIRTFEPTNGFYGNQIRQHYGERLDFRKERELFVLDRKEHVQNVILPSLEAGKHVILDRYYYSSMAYQGARYKELGLDEKQLIDDIRGENEAIAPPSDILVYFDLPPEVAIHRLQAGRDLLDPFETLETQKLVYSAYKRVLGFHANVIVLKATESPSDIFQVLLTKLFEQFESLGKTL